MRGSGRSAIRALSTASATAPHRETHNGQNVGTESPTHRSIGVRVSDRRNVEPADPDDLRVPGLDTA
jgi:hypothetical protein